MRTVSSLIFLLFCGFQALSQSASFTINVSNDSILLGNIFTATFSLDNTQSDDISFPDFSGFAIISGPNVSTSIRIMNGQMSKNTSYTFYLEPLGVGDAYIEPASMLTDDGYLETPPYLIKVYPNPDGIIQQPHTGQRQSDFFNNMPFGQNFFGEDPFDNDFFQHKLFRDFFIMPTPIEPDTSFQQPKKRKTTRI